MVDRRPGVERRDAEKEWRVKKEEVINIEEQGDGGN